MTTYKLMNFNGELSCIAKIENGIQVMAILINPESVEYQRYLKWVEEGNTPEPADE